VYAGGSQFFIDILKKRRLFRRHASEIIQQHIMRQTISILGAGWLGLPLAEYLIRQGYTVKGATTNAVNLDTLKCKGIISFLVLVTDEAIISDALEEFLQTDILIVNFPPGRRTDVEQYHPLQIRNLITQLKKSAVKKILFISATSVYPDLNREVSEDLTAAPDKGSGRALKTVEQLFRNETGFETTILRFAGLTGPGRIPGRFLAGQKDVSNGNAPVNLIHRDDCIALIFKIIKEQVWGEIFNACADLHPSRKEFYTRAAEAEGLEAPVFAAQPERDLRYKIINSEKIKHRLNYTFKYYDPLDML
jgi:nucleoside-diphosphate-sugar epimerase